MAVRSLGTLTWDLIARIGGFEQGLDKAARVAKKRSSEIQESISSAVRVSASVLGGLGASATAAFAALNAVADSVAVYQDLADQMGVTSDAVAGMQLAADLSGVSLDTVAGASVRLTSSLSKTDDETQAVGKALAALNIPIAEFKRLDPVAQLERVAKEMSVYGVGAGKTAVAVDLFGKAGAALIPILNDMAEVGVRNSRLTQDQIDAADRLTKEWARQKSVVSDLGKSLAVDLIPPLLRATSAAMDAVKQFGYVGALKFNIGRNPFANGLTEIAQAQEKVAAAQKDLQAFQPTGRFFGLDEKKLASLRETVQLREKELAYLRREYGLNSQAGAGRGFAQVNLLQLDYSSASGTDKSNKTVPKPPEAADEARRYIEGLQRQLEKTEELTVTEQVLRDLQLDRLGKVTTAQKGEILGLAGQIDAARALAEEQKKRADATEEARRAQEALLSQGKQLYESNRTPLERFNEQQDRLNVLLEAGAIDFVTAARAGEQYKKALEDAKTPLKEMDEFTKNAAKNIQSALGDGLVDILEGNFDDIGKNFAKMLTRMAADALAADIARKMFGGAVEGGTGSGWFGEALGAIGKIFNLGGPKASGGPVMPNTLYQVNERGPEMFQAANGGQFLMTGTAGGNIVPNHALGGGAPTVSVVIQNTIGDVASMAQVMQAQQGTERRIVAALARNQRYGGALA